jgi:hypothetical protein
MGHRFDPYMAFVYLHFKLTFLYRNVRRSNYVQKKLKYSPRLRSRHMRMAKYHGILCRSIMRKKRMRHLQHELSTRFYWDTLVPEMFSNFNRSGTNYREPETRLSGYRRNSVTTKGDSCFPLAGLLLRVYNVRTRRFNIGRRFRFRSTICTPMSYIPYYVHCASNMYGTVSNHFLNVSTRRLVAYARSR